MAWWGGADEKPYKQAKQISFQFMLVIIVLRGQVIRFPGFQYL